MKTAVRITMVFALLLAGHAGAGALDTRHLQSLGEVDYIAFTPQAPGRTFHVFVDLPEDYHASESSYPAVYLLDGGNTFPLLTAQHHYLRFGDEAPPLIFVGISYGADRFRDGNWRQTDFTAPSPERSFWGGAGTFLEALENELIPLIEQRYRADPERRILFGHSLGGQFVLYSAMSSPALFFGHIASNPAIAGNLEFFLNGDNLGTPGAEKSRLFIGISEMERDDLKENTLAWVAHWEKPGLAPWQLEFRILHGQTHLSSVPESFRQGLQWLLSDAPGSKPPVSQDMTPDRTGGPPRSSPSGANRSRR